MKATYGKINFDAYWESLEEKDKDTQKDFDKLPQKFKDAWDAAAQAVLDQTLDR
jgi:hypothetical protein